ncbi:hypothetical protein BY996DRAFT_6420521 [Phakopsora pachyrhizi]|nr:hypothetical protein BY996DRAFT_6420521 [Phakopsora pachyrhizi]
MASIRPLTSSRPIAASTATAQVIAPAATSAQPTLSATAISTSSGPASTPAPDRPSIAITQSSIIPAPQTIPSDPSKWGGPSNLDTGSGDPENSRSLPILVIIFLAIFGGLISLVIVYRIYRQVFFRLQRRFGQRFDSSPDIPPPPPTWIEARTTTSRNTLHAGVSNGSPSLNARLSQFPKFSQSIDVGSHAGREAESYNYLRNTQSSFEQLRSPTSNLQESSGFFANFSQEKSEIEGSRTDSAVKDQNLIHKSSPNFQDGCAPRMSMRIVSDDGQPLLPPSSTASRNSSPSRSSTLNPLFATRDHSTLSTNTLKNAMSHQSVYVVQKNRFSFIENNSPPMSTSNSSNSISLKSSNQARKSARMSFGLPHHSKSRIGLTLPPPLSQSSVIFSRPDQSSWMAFDSDSNINQPSGNESNMNLRPQSTMSTPLTIKPNNQTTKTQNSLNKEVDFSQIDNHHNSYSNLISSLNDNINFSQQSSERKNIENMNGPISPLDVLKLKLEEKSNLI